MFESRFLKSRLVLPLSIAAILALGLAALIPWGGLFVNLGTTFIGILLTIGYVDIVLKEHEAMRWESGLARIAKRLDNFATVASSQFRVAFGFTPDVYDERLMFASDDQARRTELVRVAREVLKPVARQRVASLDTADWKRLHEQLRITWDSADRLIELFGRQLDPDVIATLIDVQDSMRAIMDRYTTFPDVLGVADADLKPNTKGESSLPLRHALEGAIAEDIRAILDQSVELFDHVNRMGLRRPKSVLKSGRRRG